MGGAPKACRTLTSSNAGADENKYQKRIDLMYYWLHHMRTMSEKAVPPLDPGPTGFNRCQPKDRSNASQNC